MNSAPYIPGCVCMRVGVVVPGSINSKRTRTRTRTQNAKIKITPLSTQWRLGIYGRTGTYWVQKEYARFSGMAKTPPFIPLN